MGPTGMTSKIHKIVVVEHKYMNVYSDMKPMVLSGSLKERKNAKVCSLDPLLNLLKSSNNNTKIVLFRVFIWDSEDFTVIYGN